MTDARIVGTKHKSERGTMNNFERLMGAFCWFTPGLSFLLLALWVSTPASVYRHALWSFLSAAGALAGVVVALVFGGVLGGPEAVMFVALIVVVGAYTLFALANAAAALTGRGPLLDSSGRSPARRGREDDTP